MFVHVRLFPSSLFDVSAFVSLEYLATGNQMKRIVYLIKIMDTSWTEHCTEVM